MAGAAAPGQSRIRKARRRLAMNRLFCLLLTLLAAGRAYGARITEFVVPTSGAGPKAIISGPNGRLWFCENSGDKMGTVTTSGFFSEFALAHTTAGCEGIVFMNGFVY